MQPHRAQVPAPYGKVDGGVDLLADVDAHAYQAVLGLVNGRWRSVGSMDGHYVKLFRAYLKPLDGPHARLRPGKDGIERRGEVAERLKQAAAVGGLCAGLAGGGSAAYETLVGTAGRKEIFAEKGVPVGEEHKSAPGGHHAHVGEVAGGDKTVAPLVGEICQLGHGHTAYYLGEAVVAEPRLVSTDGRLKAGSGRKERADGQLTEVGPDVAGIVVLVTHKVEQQFGVARAEPRYPLRQLHVALGIEAAAEAYERGRGGEIVDNGVKHGRSVSAVAASPDKAYEHVDGALLGRAEALAVGGGVVQADGLKAPRIRHGHGKAVAAVGRLNAEHYAPLVAEAHEIALAATERAVDDLNHVVGLGGLGVERIVAERTFEHDHLVGVVLVEVHEGAHLLLGHGVVGAAAAVGPPVEHLAVGIAAREKVGNGAPCA